MRKFYVGNKLIIVFLIFSIVYFPHINGFGELRNQKVDEKCVIMPIHHGLIDQMEYFVVGERLKEMGYNVKYDVSWYEKIGYTYTIGERKYLKTIFAQKLKMCFFIAKPLYHKLKDSVNRICLFTNNVLKVKNKIGNINYSSISNDNDNDIVQVKNKIGNANHSRSFQLLKAFPHLEFNIADQDEVKMYKRKFASMYDYKRNHWRFKKDVSVPVYIDCMIDQWHFCLDVSSYMIRFSTQETASKTCLKYFRFEDSILDAKNIKILQKIRKEKHSVGVHVRRGDVALFSSPVEYYVKAVEKTKEMFPDAYFFFFSDEIEFVQDNIFPQLKSTVNKEIVNNSPDECYRDLFLMSECKYQIRSFGSMGAIAYMLNRYSGKKLISPSSIRDYFNIKPDVIIE